jgi:hypothetical protein
MFDMKRREFITLLGGAASPVLWPLGARAQQPDRVQRIGVLMAYSEDDPEAQAQIVAFRDGLQKLGWMEGRNIRIDTRWVTPADAELMQRFAKELSGSSRASRDLVATSRVSTFRRRRRLASGWNCSRRLRRVLLGSRCCSTRLRRHMPNFG